MSTNNVSIQNIMTKLVSRVGSIRNVKLFGDYLQKTFTSNPLKYFILILLVIFFSLIIHFIPGGDEFTWTDADGDKHTEPSAKTSANTLKNKGSYYASIALFIILSCFYIFKFVSSEYKRICVSCHILFYNYKKWRI